jgi:hypothetical protein
MNRISEYQVMVLRNGQVVIQFVLRDQSGRKSIQRIFASSTCDANSRLDDVEATFNGW